MNIARGIGAALSSYGTDRVNQMREEALKAEAEQQRLAGDEQRAAGGAALGRLYAAEPGQYEDADLRAASVAGFNPVGAFRQPGPAETFAAPVAGRDASGNPAFFRAGDRGSVQGVEGYTPEPDDPRAPPRGIGVTADDGSMWIVDPYIMGNTGIMARVPGQTGRNDRDPSWPTNISQASNLVDKMYDVPDELGRYGDSSVAPEVRMRMAKRWVDDGTPPIGFGGGSAGGIAEPIAKPLGFGEAMKRQLPPTGDSLVAEPMAVDTIQPTSGLPMITADQAEFLRTQRGMSDEQINRQYRVGR